MFFRISLLLPLIVEVLIVVLCQGVPVAELHNENQPVLLRCAPLLRLDGEVSTQNFDLLPLNTLCHPNMEKYLDCVSADIYKSNATLDIHIRSVTDYGKVKLTTKKLCSDVARLKKPDVWPCNDNPGSCQPSFRPSGKMDTDSPSFCKMVEDRRCTFQQFSPCNLQKTMLWAKYQNETQSIGCLLSDPKMQLMPVYGPELKCYSSINIDGVSDTDYKAVYESYCDQFDYNNVSTCIEETLSNVTSEELWEDKDTYMNKARKFVDNRRDLCKNMTALPNHECPVIDVSICRKMFFIPPGPSKVSVFDAIKHYAYCIWTNYMDCNIDLGLVIFMNLIADFL